MISEPALYDEEVLKVNVHVAVLPLPDMLPQVDPLMLPLWGVPRVRVTLPDGVSPDPLESVIVTVHVVE